MAAEGSCSESPVIASAVWIPLTEDDDDGSSYHHQLLQHPYFMLQQQPTSSEIAKDSQSKETACKDEAAVILPAENECKSADKTNGGQCSSSSVHHSAGGGSSSTSSMEDDILLIPPSNDAVAPMAQLRQQTFSSCYSSSSSSSGEQDGGGSSTRVRSGLLRHLSALPPSQNKKVLDALKKIKRLRIALPDPLRGVTAEYNMDAGNGTFADLVLRTEFTARTCVDNLLAMNNHSMKSTFEHRQALLRDLVANALEDFFVELSVLVGECMDSNAPTIFGGDIKLQDAIQCCMEAARNHVTDAMGLLVPPHPRRTGF